MLLGELDMDHRARLGREDMKGLVLSRKKISPFDDIAEQGDCGIAPLAGGREAVGSLGSAAVVAAEVVGPSRQQDINLKSSRQSFKSHLMRTGHRCSMVLLRRTLCSSLRRPRVIGWPGGWRRLVGRRHNAFLLQEWVYT